MKFVESKNKQDISLLMIVSTLLAITFFVLGPIQLYIGNITEFWFPISDIVYICIGVGLCAMLILFLFGLAVKGKLRVIYICVLLGLGIAFYIQGNFVLTDYGVLDGSSIAWEEYTFTAIWNTLFWFGCLAIPFVLRKMFPKNYKTVFQYIAGCVILVQLISLSILCITTDFSREDFKSKSGYLSTKGLYTVGDEKNVIVFVLDTFDQDYLDRILRIEPEILDSFDGFISYKNAISAYPTTKASMPFILTGQYYRNEQSYNEYIKDAYQETDYYEKLHDAGFDIGLYTAEMFVSENTKKEYLVNMECGDFQVKSLSELEKAMIRFTAFRYFPHLLKKYVWFYSGVFDELKVSLSTEFEPYQLSNTEFYEGLQENGLTITTENAYRLIHLIGTHPPYSMLSDMSISEDGSATAVSQGTACLNIVKSYLERLKAIGVYDKTVIIITADHGGSQKSSPIFLAKDFNGHGKVKFSEKLVGHHDLSSTIVDTLRLGEGPLSGINIFKDKNKDETIKKYYLYNWDDSWDKDYLPDMEEYVVTENKRYIFTGNIYTNNGLKTQIPYEYQMGKQILFNDKNDGRVYFTNGLYSIETNFVWSRGKNGQIILDIGNISTNLIGEIKFVSIYAAPQTLSIQSEGKVLYHALLTEAEGTVIFTIPADCVQNGRLILNLEYPDAVSTESSGREIAFAFSSMCFYPETEKEGR